MSGYGHMPFGRYPFGHPSTGMEPIQDLAHNALATPSTVQMLGWVDPPPPPEELGLDMYRFIIQSIREEDAKEVLFLKRYFEGPQRVWQAIQARIFAMRGLWDVTNVDDEFLPHLQGIVGWTGSLTAITDALDVDTLRRLIATSAALWRQRGPEDTTIDILQLVAKAQCRIWNWFDFRWVLGETALGVEREGADPWMIELPGPPDMDEMRSNLRIVDDGSLNRSLVVNLVRLMRSIGERVEISYIDFMDLFTVDGDDGLWTAPLGSMVVANGNASMADDLQEELALVDHEPSTWSEYVAFGRIKGTATAGGRFGLGFYQDATGDNGYYAVLCLDTNRVEVLQKIGGSIFLVSGAAFTPWGTLYPDVYYGFRVQTVREGATNRIKVYVDGDEILSITHPSYGSGTMGLWHEAGATIECDEIEMYQVPLESELVDINP